MDMVGNGLPGGVDVATLTALVASRICHDLVNPLGAVTNGIELLELSGKGGEEMALISGAASQALARIEMLRLALGAAAPGQVTALRTIRKTLKTLGEGARLTRLWDPDTDPERPEAKRVLLAMLCAESALPLGGEIRYDGAVLHASGPQLRLDPALWTPLSEGAVPRDLASAQVQFALLPLEMSAQGRVLRLDHDEAAMRLTL